MNNESQNIAPIELLTKYFANEASSEERKEVETWRLANTENQKEFNAFKKLWSITGQTSGTKGINIDSEWARMEKSIGTQPKTINLFSRVISIAASLVIISVLAFLGVNQLSTTTIKTTIAELSEITLPDGSTISLNADSKISYTKGFGEKHRKVTLKGEAYFEVQKNTFLPFIIAANEATIEVVGTKFNVKAYKKQSEVKVFVTEGKVRFYEAKQPKKKTVLVAGESGIYDRKVKMLRKTPVSNKNDISWKTRILEFDNTPLFEVAEVIENTYQIKLMIDPKVGQCPITVRFEEQDLASVLKVLKTTLNLEFTTEQKGVLKISGTGCD